MEKINKDFLKQHIFIGTIPDKATNNNKKQEAKK